MKIILIYLLFTLNTTPFCEGWDDGYVEGYCYAETFDDCITPIPPICPIPDVGEDTYNDGYNRGFLEGINDNSN